MNPEYDSRALGAAQFDSTRWTFIMFSVGDSEGTSYEETAKTLAFWGAALKTLIHRLRKRYSAILWEEIALTVSDPNETNGKLDALCDALIAAQRRLMP